MADPLIAERSHPGLCRTCDERALQHGGLQEALGGQRGVRQERTVPRIPGGWLPGPSEQGDQLSQVSPAAEGPISTPGQHNRPDVAVGVDEAPGGSEADGNLRRD